MSGFKVKKIAGKSGYLILREKIGAKFGAMTPVRLWLLKSVAIILALLVIAEILLGVYRLGEKLTYGLGQILPIFNTTLQKDVSGNINVLLVGVGGAEHEGPDLTDSVILASFNPNKNTLALFSLPRDLYVKIPGDGENRINKVYEYGKGVFNSQEGLKLLMRIMEKITGVKIPYYTKIDFEGLVGVVDALGGIEINVPKTLIDYQYPQNDLSGYTTFKVEAGWQHFDGKTALKYARSRHSTSDFDRGSRQHQLIQAIKEQALQKKYLTNPVFLRELYLAFRTNVETNVTLNELIRCAYLMRKISQANIVSKVIHDDPTQEGGFLYTPPREDFGGAFVLIPSGATVNSIEYYKEIQLYLSFIFNTPEFYLENARIEIVNGTGKLGLAGNLASRLKLFGFNITKTANAPNREKYEKTQIVVRNSHSTATLKNLAYFISGETIKISPQAGEQVDSDITIMIGKDYKKL